MLKDKAKFLILSAVFVFHLNLDAASAVNCGGHSASTCSDCPRGNGASWCNKDCTWKSNRCIPNRVSEVESVFCGGHYATTCSDCPRGNGASWCNGDCSWKRNRCIPKAGNCNMDLVNAINQYRAQRGLNKIPVDDTLCKVAYYHSWDQQYGSGNGHSWGTNSKNGYSWRACNFDSDWNCMWKKPKEFNRSWRNGDGYEVSVGPGGGMTASIALRQWKKSPPHNDVLVNQGMWSNSKWTKLGAAFVGSYGNAWFAE